MSANIAQRLKFAAILNQTVNLHVELFKLIMNIKFNRPEHNREQNSSISFPINQDRNENKNTQAPAVEWARIAPNKVIVANAERAWLLEDTAQTNSSSSADQFLTQTMEGAGSIATTRQLLDGAIAAAKYAVNSDVRPPALTANRWVWRLAGYYHLCQPIPELIRKAQSSFAASERWMLANWAESNAQEESGHDLLALKDIQALGYDPYSVVEALVPPTTTILIDYLRRSVKDSNPIDCVGYAYTMERLALKIDENYIQKIQALFSPDVNATRCLRMHSSVGADLKHVEETIEMVSMLNPNERMRVAIATYETAIICFTAPNKGYISDEKLQQILKTLKRY